MSAFFKDSILVISSPGTERRLSFTNHLSHSVQEDIHALHQVSAILVIHCNFLQSPQQHIYCVSCIPSWWCLTMTLSASRSKFSRYVDVVVLWNWTVCIQQHWLPLMPYRRKVTGVCPRIDDLSVQTVWVFPPTVWELHVGNYANGHDQ